MSSVVQADIEEGLVRLGLRGAKAEVHASMRSFGHVAGEHDTVTAALTATLATILVPSFSSIAEVNPPPNDHPLRNGLDYANLPQRPLPARPFLPESSPIDRGMGITSRAVAALPGAYRSAHPLDSWTAWGEDAEHLVREHEWDDPFRPIKRLADLGGYILLIGVTFSRCSAVHLAEEMAGRAPFIRWVVDSNGKTRRVRTGGDGDGFDRLHSSLLNLMQVTYIGLSRAICVPLQPFLDRTASLIRADASCTICAPGCVACRDACAGGPIP